MVCNKYPKIAFLTAELHSRIGAPHSQMLNKVLTHGLTENLCHLSQWRLSKHQRWLSLSLESAEKGLPCRTVLLPLEEAAIAPWLCLSLELCLLRSECHVCFLSSWQTFVVLEKINLIYWALNSACHSGKPSRVILVKPQIALWGRHYK